jgi:hypothetical protein
MNTASTECSPQNEFIFDDMLSKPKEVSPFNFLDEKPNYINIFKDSLVFNENENEINPHLKRDLSYSDLNIHMKKDESFNLKCPLKKENITNNMILSYLTEEMSEKIFIEEDYKYNEKELEGLYYCDEEEEEEDEEMINAILMYNNRNITSEYKKILRERLKRRIKEDEKQYKKEEKLYKENEKKREKKIKKKKKEILKKQKKECDNGSLYKLLNSDLLDESLFIKYLSSDSESITDTLINLTYNKKNIRDFIPNILHEIISIYSYKKQGCESIAKFLIDFSIKNISFAIKTCLIILSLAHLGDNKKLMNLKNQIEINISLLTNEYNLKQITKTNLSVYDIKTIEELDLLEEENDNNKNTPDYVFLSKYYELTMLFYNEIYSLPKKLAKFIENNILKNNNSNNGYKISKMDNHSLIQTEFINLVKELNNKIGNLSQYIETIKKDINDGKIKNKLINLFRGYIIPIEYKENKTSRYTFDMDNFENNYILINIISDYCELKFSSGDKYYKNFEIKIAFEIIQVKDAKSWELTINNKNIKNIQKITISSKKKKETKYDPFNHLFNGNPDIDFIKNNSIYHNFDSHNILFYNLIFDKDITGDFVINKFKKSFNDLFLSPVDNEIKNESNYIIKIPDIISINKNCFLLECICCNNNLVSLKQIENDIKIYTKNYEKYNIENKENILINKRQFNNKYKLYEEPENKDLPVVSFIYDIFQTSLIENDNLQKNLIESFIYNIIIEYLFNNKSINIDIYSNEDETNIYNNLYIDKNGFLYLIKNDNHYLSTDNSLMYNKFKLNEKLMKLLVDNDISSNSFSYFVNLIIYYICEIKKYYYSFENYVNIYLDGTRPSNWSNKLKDWVIYSLQERFFVNKTDNDITNTIKKDIYDINMEKNKNVSKLKFLFDSIKGKFLKKKFN